MVNKETIDGEAGSKIRYGVTVMDNFYSYQFDKLNKMDNLLGKYEFLKIIQRAIENLNIHGIN